jgi:dTDP-glucose 4,6-dehydratase
MAAKRVLITGGGGFIGSHLCDLFLGKGYEVTALDNFLTGDPKNIAHLKTHPHFRLMEHDIVKPINYPDPVDFILHFASPASPIDYLKLPIQTLKIGSYGTHHVLGLAKEKKAVFLIASTSEVYGDPLEHPQKETYWGNVNPIGPRGVYDEAKRFGEALTMAYHRAHCMNTKIVRIFNTFGPRMRLQDGRAIPAFFTQALKGEPVTLFGDGSQTRSLCYVSDLIAGIEKLMLSDLNEPVNIGNPNELSMMTLAKKIVTLAGSKSKIILEPLPVDDPRVRQPDITIARSKLGWEPKVIFEPAYSSRRRHEPVCFNCHSHV